MINNAAYNIEREELTFKEALARCENERQGGLFVPQTEKKNNEVYAYISEELPNAENYWLGINIHPITLE